MWEAVGGSVGGSVGEGVGVSEVEWLGWLAICKSVRWAPQFAQCFVRRLTDLRANLFGKLSPN